MQNKPSCDKTERLDYSVVASVVLLFTFADNFLIPLKKESVKPAVTIIASESAIGADTKIPSTP